MWFYHVSMVHSLIGTFSSTMNDFSEELRHCVPNKLVSDCVSIHTLSHTQMIN